LKENALYSIALLAVNDLAFGETNFGLLVNSNIALLKDKILCIVLKFLFDWIVVHGLATLKVNDVLKIEVERKCNGCNLFWIRALKSRSCSACCRRCNQVFLVLTIERTRGSIC
jgi:hypothetical protein